MPKTFTELTRHALNGPTMGTRWAAQVFAGPAVDPAAVQLALQAAVEEVDKQMSTWKPESDLMRFNAAPVGVWLPLPLRLLQVLSAGLEIGKLSGGAFDIGMGDAVAAWGFGADDANPARIGDALKAARRPAHELLELDHATGRAIKHGPLAIDLSGIAKGYGVDRLAETVLSFGIENALVTIDGELRALGVQPDGTPWSVAVERPEYGHRAPHAVLALEEASVATSGDYRHWVELAGGQKLSHTMDPRRGGPLTGAPASVTVVAETCMEADAFATALMVMGVERGMVFARDLNLDVLFLVREGEEIGEVAVGALFGAPA